MKTTPNTRLETTHTTENKIPVLESRLMSLEHENLELKAKVKYYEEQFRLFQHQKFGSSNEKIHPEQLSINEVEKLSQQPHEEPVLDEVIEKRRTGKSKSRKTYADLPVEEIIYTLTGDDQLCPTCDHPLHEMKTEIRKELVIIPAKVKMVHHKKIVYACRKCDNEGTTGTIITAPSPKPPLPGSMASASLLSYIIDNKYNLALPLYRQEEALLNYGLDISRQNMAHWVMRASDKWLKSIYDRMHAHLLKERMIHADESPLQVIDVKKGNCYMWLYASGEKGNHPIYLYDYQPGRTGKYPKMFLDGFKGCLQTDGYKGYNLVEGVTQVGCMAHARRKYTDALKAMPKGCDLSETKANEALKFFKDLYILEKAFKELTPDERRAARLKESTKIMDAYKDWLTDQKAVALPKGKLGEAINYSINQWDKLSAYLYDGHVAIDNNRAERAIKPFVIGRKNYLFSKSPKGATASALCYSIVQTAKANSLNPFEYLNYLFEQLPNTDVENPDVLDALLPWSKELPNEFRIKREELT